MKKKRDIIYSILLISIFLIGLTVMLYPTISNYLNTRNHSTAIVDYSTSLKEMDEELIDRLWAEAEDYNRRLYETYGAFFKPELVEGYETTLKLNNTEVIGYVSVPRINVTIPIMHGSDEVTLSNALGHLQGTSLPIGGENTHSVIVGHRGLPSSKLFTDLDLLEKGDTFTITVLNRRMTYSVDQILVVEPSETDQLQIIPGGDYCTLLTCTPYGINTHRLLVRGTRVDQPDPETGTGPETVEIPEVPQDDADLTPVIFIAAGIVAVVFIINAVVLTKHKKENKKGEEEA